MAFTELLKNTLEDSRQKEVQEKKLREAAISARSAFRFVAYEANPNDQAGKLRVEKDTPRGLIHIQVDPENPATATWVQRETTTDYFSTVKYSVSIGTSGDFTTTRQVIRKSMNDVPLNEPISFRIGPLVVGIGYQYASTNIKEFDRLEKGLHEVDRSPQPFVPTVEFFDDLRKELLHGPTTKTSESMSSEAQQHTVIDFHARASLARTG